MSCKFACTCGGICPGCTTREPEEYFGQAEDILSNQHGFANYDTERNYYEEQYHKQQKEG
jgi:hypothetical protein